MHDLMGIKGRVRQRMRIPPVKVSSALWDACTDANSPGLKASSLS